ncbi:MAG: PIN domain-containing protein [Candidatus Aenigmarchaeota archaeon]|nr:PIN domain-containing protein [Candidatus Aenigmarchaeota archaeon]
MPYADSDFFLALIKEEDWLAERAEKILEQYKGRIWTSHWVIVEILMLAKKHNLDPENVIFRIRQLARIEGDFLILIAVAHLMKERGMRVFDALHALSCGHDSIISSDRIFDKIGLERIKLEDGG